MERETSNKLYNNNHNKSDYLSASSQRQFLRTTKTKPMFLSQLIDINHLETKENMAMLAINENILAPQNNAQDAFVKHIQSMIQKIKMGFGDLSSDMAEHPKQYQAIIEYLSKNTHQHFSLLSHVVSSTEKTNQKNASFCIKEMIDNILFLIYPHCQSQKIKCHTKVTKDLIKVSAKKHKIYLVLLNLMLNAALTTFRGNINVMCEKISNAVMKITIDCSGNPISENYFAEECARFNQEFLNYDIRSNSTSNLQLVREYLNDINGYLKIEAYQGLPKEGLKFTCLFPVYFQKNNETICKEAIC